MTNTEDFETTFFQYQLPIPNVTVYSKQYARSNDLRLLLEIGTGSYLRMFTDNKTNIVHFICKNKGQNCLDIQALLTSDGNGYYFPNRIGENKHEFKCSQEGANYHYLKIYNLLKLKKELI